MLEDIDPRPDIILDDGDILVILGLQQNIIHFEKYITSGKIVS
jgi:K+/H+ antiporter YhaU regulatory subunit KhtT